MDVEQQSPACASPISVATVGSEMVAEYLPRKGRTDPALVPSGHAAAHLDGSEQLSITVEHVDRLWAPTVIMTVSGAVTPQPSPQMRDMIR